MREHFADGRLFTLTFQPKSMDFQAEWGRELFRLKRNATKLMPPGRK